MQLTPEDLKRTPEELSAKIVKHYEGMHDKNTELLTEKKRLNKLVQQKADIDVDIFNNAVATVKKYEEEKLTDEERAVIRRNERAVADKKKDDEILSLQDTLTERDTTAAINKGLRKAGVLVDGAYEAVSSLFKTKVAMSDSNIPMIGDKTVVEFAVEYAECDGKNFFIPKNSGGGGNGSGGGGAASLKEYTDDKGNLNHTKVAQLRKGDAESRAQADSIVAAYKQQNK